MEIFSVYRFCSGVDDGGGALILSTRVPFLYRDLPSNIPHVVREGDTLWGLAKRYYAVRSYAAQLWPIIADFQVDADGIPTPIHDPTIALTPGSTIWVPSLRTVDELILNENRRVEHDV